jgi:hypothetical protein
MRKIMGDFSTRSQIRVIRQALSAGKPHPHRPLNQKGFSGYWQTAPAVILTAGLAFDPHVLWLVWSAERQETVATTSAATCRAAIDAIGAGRWLADDPPVAMACRQGSAFPPGWDCIAGHNCRDRTIGSGAR